MLYFTACSLISGVSGTIRQCNAKGNDVNRCKTQDISLAAGGNKKVHSPSGQNKLCICYEDLCNNSPWLEWAKPTVRRRTTHRPTTRRLTTRRPTTHKPTTRKQAVVTTESLHHTDGHDVTWYSSDTLTDFEGVPLPTDSQRVSLTEKSMPTGSMGAHILPANYNAHYTDKIQSNGVKKLNDDMVFLILLTLLIYIFW